MAAQVEAGAGDWAGVAAVEAGEINKIATTARRTAFNMCQLLVQRSDGESDFATGPVPRMPSIPQHHGCDEDALYPACARVTGNKKAAGQRPAAQ